MIGIYAIKNNITKKYYVGQSKHVKRRWIEHKSELNKNRHANCHLQSSWNKYGYDNFEFMLLEECKNTELDEKERFWIMKLNSYSEGYNLDFGGQGIPEYKHTDKEILKMRKIQNPKIVLQFDKNKNLLKKWEGGTSHIRKELKYTKECIDKCCTHQKKDLLYKNCYWMYEEEYLNKKFSWDSYLQNKNVFNITYKNSAKNKLSKPVYKLDTDGNIIQLYSSITEASFDVGAANSNIIAVIKGTQKSCRGYKWKYAM